MADVHAQRDLRLLAVAAERSLADQDADDDAAFEIAQRLHAAQSASVARMLFHRQEKRETHPCEKLRHRRRHAARGGSARRGETTRRRRGSSPSLCVRDVAALAQVLVHEAPLRGRHRPQSRSRGPRSTRPVRDAVGLGAQRLLAPPAVAGRVDDDPQSARAAQHDPLREVLHRLDDTRRRRRQAPRRPGPRPSRAARRRSPSSRRSASTSNASTSVSSSSRSSSSGVSSSSSSLTAACPIASCADAHAAAARRLAHGLRGASATRGRCSRSRRDGVAGASRRAVAAPPLLIGTLGPSVACAACRLLRDHRDVRRDPVHQQTGRRTGSRRCTKTNGSPIDIRRWLRVGADRHHHARRERLRAHVEHDQHDQHDAGRLAS